MIVNNKLIQKQNLQRVCQVCKVMQQIEYPLNLKYQVFLELRRNNKGQFLLKEIQTKNLKFQVHLEERDQFLLKKNQTKNLKFQVHLEVRKK